MARTPKRADALDAAIVALLRDDGRLTNLEIARRLGSTESTIRRRLARLMQEEGFRIVGSLDGEGRQTQMVFFVHAQPGRRIEVAERLIAHPRVQRIELMTGGYDLLVHAAFDADAEALQFLVHELEAAADIASVQAGHVLKQLVPSGARGLSAAPPPLSGPEAALRTFALRAADLRSMGEVADLAGITATRGFGMQAAAVYLREKTAASETGYVGGHGLPAGFLRQIRERYKAYDDRIGIRLHVVDTRLHVYVEDTTTDPILAGLHDIFEQAGIRSALYLPLLHGEHRIGTLAFYTTSTRRYDDNEIVLAQVLADQLAIAMARSRARTAEGADALPSPVPGSVAHATGP